MHFRSLAFEDVDEYAAALAHWNLRIDQVSLGKFAGRVDCIDTPHLRIFRKRSNRVLLESGCSPASVFSVAIPLHQSSDAYQCGSMLRPGCASLLNCGAELTLRSAEAFDLLVVSIDRQRMLDALATQDPELADRFELLAMDSLVFESPLIQTLAQLLLSALESPDAAGPIKPAHNALLSLFEQVCLLIARSIFGDQHGRQLHRVRDSRQQLVTRAASYLERSWFEPMRVSEICRELNADRRTLQNAFQEVLGVSPNAFYKNVRLNRAHQELKRSAGRDEPICDVAVRWGFWHLSQFARDYQRAFGELPSDTRRHARG